MCLVTRTNTKDSPWCWAQLTCVLSTLRNVMTMCLQDLREPFNLCFMLCWLFFSNREEPWFYAVVELLLFHPQAFLRLTGCQSKLWKHDAQNLLRRMYGSKESNRGLAPHTRSSWTSLFISVHVCPWWAQFFEVYRMMYFLGCGPPPHWSSYVLSSCAEIMRRSPYIAALACYNAAVSGMMFNFIFRCLTIE